MSVLSVIEFFDESGEIIVTKVPQQGSAAITFGSQLVVQESQLAYFYKDGRAFDCFSSGRHTLKSKNLPILSSAFGAAFGKSPFRCYVYFISTKTFINLGWGTRTPILFRDTEFRMLQLRANGAFSIKIADIRTFLDSIVGTRGLETTFAIQDFFRGIIVSKLNEAIGQTMTSILDLAVSYSAIASKTKQSVADDFSQYGVALVDLIIEGITPPDEVQAMINRASGVAAQDAEKYREIGIVDAMQSAAKNPGGNTGEGLSAGMGMGMGMAMAQNFNLSQGQTTPATEATPSSGSPSPPGPPPPPAERQFFLYKNNLQTGPFPESVIRQKLVANEIEEHDLLWAEGIANWTPASSILSGMP